MINPITRWFEIAELKCAQADYTAGLLVLEKVWLTRYSWHTEIICDHGKEFMTEVIDILKDDYGIIQKPITTQKPQANAMVKQAHQTLGNMLCAYRVSMIRKTLT
jgi:hypothetical protein